MVSLLERVRSTVTAMEWSVAPWISLREMSLGGSTDAVKLGAKGVLLESRVGIGSGRAHYI